jgi:hypothetical protein
MVPQSTNSAANNEFGVLQFAIVQAAGPIHSVIHAITMKDHHGHGATLTYAEIATASKTSVSTVRRFIGDLVDLGLLQVEAQVQKITGQEGNLYRVPSAHRGHPPVHSEHAWSATAITNDSLEESVVGEVATGSSDSSLDTEDSADNSPVLSMDAESCWVSTTWQWLPLGTEMPAMNSQTMGKRKNVFQLLDEALWLVAQLECYLLPGVNAQRLARGWKEPQDTSSKGWVKRKSAWLRDARTLLQSHPLAEVVERFDWVMNHHKGILPFDIIDKNGLQRWDKERKVTNVRKIVENYTELSTQFRLSTVRADEVAEGDSVEVESDQAWVNPIDSFTEESALICAGVWQPSHDEPGHAEGNPHQPVAPRHLAWR